MHLKLELLNFLTCIIILVAFAGVMYVNTLFLRNIFSKCSKKKKNKLDPEADCFLLVK